MHTAADRGAYRSGEPDSYVECLSSARTGNVGRSHLRFVWHAGSVFRKLGAEANEAALKLVRMFGHKRGEPEAQTLVMERAWHGRTLATAATGSEKARKGFEPFPTGFISVPYNDIAAVKRAAEADPRVLWLEVLQGEGGIYVADLEYVKALRQLCDQRGWLLMIDEVQSGIGRTGKWFAHQWADIKPDVMTLAKGSARACQSARVAAGPAAGVFGPGNHGTTFGGGPLAMRAGIETLEIIETDGLMANAVAQGERIVGGLKRRLAGVRGVVQIRGMGLMIGIELDRPCGELVRQALAARLINVTHDTVIRMLPPLILSAEEAELIVERLAPLISAFCVRRVRSTQHDREGGLNCMSGGIRHFLQFADFNRAELEWVFERSRIIKDRFKRYQFYQPLADRTLAMVFEKASTRTRVVRSRHVSNGRIGDSYHHRRFAVGPCRTHRRHCASHFADGRHRDDPHLRASEARALRRAFARAGNQRADQRISPVSDSGRHLHVYRASRTDRRANRGLDRRCEQHGVHVAAGRA